MIAPPEAVARHCWVADQLRERNSWQFAMTDGLMQEAQALVEWSRLEEDQINAMTHYSMLTPHIERLAYDIWKEIRDRSGVAWIKTRVLDETALRLLYMKLGLALGQPIETYGRLYEVKDAGVSYRETAVPVSQTRESTGMHTDSSNKDVLPIVVGLACVRTALRGGESRLVSAAQVHERLRQKHPRLLARLYDDFSRDVVTPGGDRSDASIAANRFPVFAYTSRFAPLFPSTRRLRFRYMRYWIERGHERINEPLDQEARDAFDALDAELADPAHVLSFRMEPGDMLFIDNTTIAHDRDAYEDNPDAPRLMLRLWLA